MILFLFLYMISLIIVSFFNLSSFNISKFSFNNFKKLLLSYKLDPGSPIYAMSDCSFDKQVCGSLLNGADR